MFEPEQAGHHLDPHGSGHMKSAASRPNSMLDQSFVNLTLADDAHCGKTGFEEERFMEPVERHFLCGICLEVLRDPVICAAEHSFCRPCLQRHLTTSSTCPECGVAINEERLPRLNRILLQLLKAKQLKCLYHSMGCTHVSALEHMEEHEWQCPYAMSLDDSVASSVSSSHSNLHLAVDGNNSAAASTTASNRNSTSNQGDLITEAPAALHTQHSAQPPLQPSFHQQRVDSRPKMRRSFGDGKPAGRNSSSSLDSRWTPEDDLTKINWASVNVLRHMSFDAECATPTAVFDRHHHTVSASGEDCIANARTNVVLTVGQAYWEMRIDAMWDPEQSDGTVRFGIVSSLAFNQSPHAIGDDDQSVGWWDSCIDGAVYCQLPVDVRFRVGDRISMLIDLDNAFPWLRLYHNGVSVGQVCIPKRAYYPAVHTRTKLDRVSIVQEPQLPI